MKCWSAAAAASLRALRRSSCCVRERQMLCHSARRCRARSASSAAFFSSACATSRSSRSFSVDMNSANLVSMSSTCIAASTLTAHEVRTAIPTPESVQECMTQTAP